MTSPSSDAGLDLLGPVRPVRSRANASRWLPAAIAAAAVAIAGTGAVAAVSMQGGGAQPEDVLPAEAIGLVKVDFDPGAQQKLALYELGRKFPALKGKLTGEDNLRDDALRAVFASTDEISYDRDVKPWIGSRAGVAFLPSGGDEPGVVVAVQYRDRDAAEAGLRKAESNAPSDSPLAHAFVDGEDYVLVGDDKAVVDKAAGADRHLSDEKAFSRAVDKLDGDQLLLGWADAKRVWDAVPADARKQFEKLGDALDPSGQLVFGLRAETGALELTGRAVDLRSGTEKGSTPTRPVSGLIAKLPSESLLAVDIGGAGETLAANYDSFEKGLGDAAPELLGTLREAGISLPEDLKALFGTETALTVYGTMDAPQVAARTRSDDPARAETVATKLLGLLGGGTGAPAPPGLITRTPDGIVIGSDPDVVAATKADGDLGTQPRFRRVLPSIDGASAVVYVDVTKALDLTPLEGKAKDNTRPLEAMGLTVSGGANGTFRLRFTFR